MWHKEFSCVNGFSIFGGGSENIRISKGNSEPSWTSNMGLCAKIVNGFPWAIFAKSSILDVRLGSDCISTLKIAYFESYYLNKSLFKGCIKVSNNSCNYAFKTL